MSGYNTYEYRASRRHNGRSALGYWVPLAVTLTAATLGLAAWVWSERHDEDDAEDDQYEDGEKDMEQRKIYQNQQHQDDGQQEGISPRPTPGYNVTTSGDISMTDKGVPRESGEALAGVMARMSGAIRRTPSPQQIFDEATRRVAAGVAAAGVVVGGALSSIREESRDDYGDHSRWSEEADMRAAPDDAPRDKATRPGASGVRQPSPDSRGAAGKSSTVYSGPAAPSERKTKRKTVAIVLSVGFSDALHEAGHGDHHENASILSHLPSHIDHARSQLFVLIYAPDLKQHPLSTTTSTRPAGSVTSSFSNIAHEDARTPGEEVDKPLASIDPEPAGELPPGSSALLGSNLTASESSSFQGIYSEALAIVEKESMVLPFTTPSGHVHILRHLVPEVVYIQESLTGGNGDLVTQISGWVGQVVVVVGAEGGHGGLVDSEDETAQEAEATQKWWQNGERVGLGKGIEVVDGLRLGDDWRRRVGGHD